jgi:hypothetical protein
MEVFVFTGLGVAILTLIMFVYPVFVKAKKDRPTGEFPREIPKRAASPVITSPYVYEREEEVVSPFVEQIEGLVRARLNADPRLKKYRIDFGESMECGLEIWVNGKKYSDINKLPDKDLRLVFCDSIREWNVKQTLSKERLGAGFELRERAGV